MWSSTDGVQWKQESALAAWARQRSGRAVAGAVNQLHMYVLAEVLSLLALLVQKYKY